MPTLCSHTDGRDSPGVLYEQQWVKDQIGKIQGFIRANIAWLGIASSIGQRVLDYACGHGTISLVSDTTCRPIMRLTMTTGVGKPMPECRLSGPRFACKASSEI